MMSERTWSCCCQVIAARRGAGFFISSRTIVTCAHNVDGYSLGTKLTIVTFSNDHEPQSRSATLLHCDTKLDIALLEAEFEADDFLVLSAQTPILDDRLQGYGFPNSSGTETRDTFTATHEGTTHYINIGGLCDYELKFKQGQVVPGFSGGPLINLRTGHVCGIISTTRDRRMDLGGWAIPAVAVIEECRKKNLQIKYIKSNDKSTHTASLKWAVPELPENHVERALEVDHLLQHLSKRRRLLLHGAPGSGKTTLASELLQSDKFHDLFPDGVIWATLGSNPDIFSIQADLLKAVGEAEPLSWTIQGVQSMLKTKLQGKKLLLVLDDVWSIEDFVKFNFEGSSIKLLVTSRLESLTDGGLEDTYLLDRLNADQWKRIVKLRTPSLEPSASVTRFLEELFELLDGNALAANLIGSLISRRIPVELIVSATKLAAAFENRASWEGNLIEQRIYACYRLSLENLMAANPSVWRRALLLSVVRGDGTLKLDEISRFWGVDKNVAQATLWALSDDAFLSSTGVHYRLHGLTRIALASAALRTPAQGPRMSEEDMHSEVCKNLGLLDGTNLLHAALTNPYTLRHFVWHLVKSEKHDYIRMLCLDQKFLVQTWPSVSERAGEISSYIANLRLIMQENLRLRPFNYSVQINCLLASVSLTTVAGQLVPGAITYFLLCGHWSPERALMWCDAFASNESHSEYYLAVLLGLDAIQARSGPDPRVQEYRDRCLRTALTRLQTSTTISKKQAEDASTLIAKAPRDQQLEIVQELIRRIADPIMQLTIARGLCLEAKDHVVSSIFRTPHDFSNFEQSLQILSAAMPVGSARTQGILEQYFIHLVKAATVVDPSPPPRTESATDLDDQGNSSASHKYPELKIFLDEEEPPLSQNESIPRDSQAVWSQEELSEPVRAHGIYDYRRYLPVEMRSDNEVSTGSAKSQHSGGTDSTKFWKDDRNVSLMMAAISYTSSDCLEILTEVLKDVPISSVALKLAEHCQLTKRRLNIRPRATSEGTVKRVKPSGASFARMLIDLLISHDRVWREHWLAEAAVTSIESIASPIYGLGWEDHPSQVVMENEASLVIDTDKLQERLDRVAIERLRFEADLAVRDIRNLLSEYGAEHNCLVLLELLPTLNGLPEDLYAAAVRGLSLFLPSPANRLLVSESMKAEANHFFSSLVNLEVGEVLCTVELAHRMYPGDELLLLASGLGRIGDEKSQTEAYIALVAATEARHRAELRDYWEDVGKFGVSSVTRSRTIGLLGVAISNDKLVEIIHSLAREEGEWWVVEAFKSVLAQLTTKDELRSYHRAARMISLSDLRTKLLGKLASRCLDLSLEDLFKEVLRAMGSGPLVDDELVDLAVRAASMGDVVTVHSVGEFVSDLESRDRLRWLAGLELAAVGLILEGKLLHSELMSPHWKSAAVSVALYTFENSSVRTEDMVRLANRQSVRQRSDEPSSRAEFAGVTARVIPDALRKQLLLVSDQYSFALDCAEDLTHFWSLFWCGDGETIKPAHVVLGALSRSKLLSCIASLPELFAIDGGGEHASSTLLAIKACSEEWP